MRTERGSLTIALSIGVSSKSCSCAQLTPLRTCVKAGTEHMLGLFESSKEEEWKCNVRRGTKDNGRALGIEAVKHKVGEDQESCGSHNNPDRQIITTTVTTERQKGKLDQSNVIVLTHRRNCLRGDAPPSTCYYSMVLGEIDVTLILAYSTLTRGFSE
jgi:hypothetical protein